MLAGVDAGTQRVTAQVEQSLGGGEKLGGRPGPVIHTIQQRLPDWQARLPRSLF